MCNVTSEQVTIKDLHQKNSDTMHTSATTASLPSRSVPRTTDNITFL